MFVNAATEYMQQMGERYGLHALQLHGQESPEQCQALRQAGYTIIKVFSVGDEHFDFSTLQPYQASVDFFLFDTRGKQPGGNGFAFDWELLRNYPLDTPFLLSGGIGLDNMDQLKRINLLQLHALDVNSRFETEPGRKDTRRLHEFMTQLSGLPQ